MSTLQGKDASPKDRRNFSDRDINWFWNYNQHFKYHSYVQYNSMLEKRKIIHEYFDLEKDGEYFLKKSLLEKDKFLVDENDLNWINTSDDRLLIFIINALLKFNRILPTPSQSTRNYSYFLDLIDNLNISKDIKIAQLSQIKILWSNQQDNSKDIKWIEYNNKEQVEWAWDYLKKGFFLPFLPTPPTDNHQRYSYVLSAIDFINFSNSSEAKELILMKMKKTWAQKKYRDSGKIKKPHHLPLTKKRHEELKELAAYFNKSVPDVLDFAIEKIYIEWITDQEGKSKKF